jgi:hypothetical protein
MSVEMHMDRQFRTSFKEIMRVATLVPETEKYVVQKE